jgi:PIN domain nuclease of toxin-antitoxin system
MGRAKPGTELRPDRRAGKRGVPVGGRPAKQSQNSERENPRDPFMRMAAATAAEKPKSDTRDSSHGS